MQPTFTVSVAADVEDARAGIRAAIESPELKGHAVMAGNCVEFKIEAKDQRFWSPHLSVQVAAVDAHSEFIARFSPRPEIWTMFMAIYFVAAFGCCAGVIYSYVQWMLGQIPWALAGLPGGLIVIVGLHSASLIGQDLSSDQMELLRSRFDRAIKIAFDRKHNGSVRRAMN